MTYSLCKTAIAILDIVQDDGQRSSWGLVFFSLINMNNNKFLHLWVVQTADHKILQITDTLYFDSLIYNWITVSKWLIDFDN